MALPLNLDFNVAVRERLASLIQGRGIFCRLSSSSYCREPQSHGTPCNLYLVTMLFATSTSTSAYAYGLKGATSGELEKAKASPSFYLITHLSVDLSFTTEKLTNGAKVTHSCSS